MSTFFPLPAHFPENLRAFGSPWRSDTSPTVTAFHFAFHFFSIPSTYGGRPKPAWLLIKKAVFHKFHFFPI
jgi:hypothetical protein